MNSAALQRRLAAWLAGVWTGLVAGVGLIAAPLLFTTLPRSEAGAVAARLFALDAGVGLGFGALLLTLAVQEARRGAESGGLRFSTDMLLVLGALFCIVAGHYAIEPMLEGAGRGEGPSFAVLHGVATAFFILKLVVVAVLAWRLAGLSAAGASARVRAAAPTS